MSPSNDVTNFAYLAYSVFIYDTIVEQKNGKYVVD